VKGRPPAAADQGAAVTRRALAVLLLTVALCGWATPALAHVTVAPDSLEPGAFTTYTVRVPNERDDAATTAVEVQIPDGIELGSYRPVPGWEIEVADGVISIAGGRIEPGQFQAFELRGQNPEEPTDLRFAAVQTYDSGEVVEWIGDPDSDTPASIVPIGGEPGSHGAPGDDDEPSEQDTSESELAAEPAPAADDSEPAAEQSGNSPLAALALVAGLAGLGLGAAAFVRSGRSHGGRTGLA